ncbi:MAG: abortive infection bacteriophage resistance protein [Motiliproteus sp.]|jgi:abortive infection bacteriophage resistance protein
MAYECPWKTFPEQLELLKSRNMTVTDEAAAISYLERIGYYRLSAYWYPFRVFEFTQDPKTKKICSQRTNNFVDNTQFIDAVELYIFDKKLRLHVLDALERIEVSVRVDIAYLLGNKGTFAYSDISLFHPTFATKPSGQSGLNRFESWQGRYKGLLNRSKEDFVKHYKQTHGPELPIWVAVEVWDFGAMSQLFSMITVPDQRYIASKYGVSDFKIFASWLRSLNYLRNLAAHHSRLWNRNVIDQPKLPKVGELDWCDAFIGKPDLIAKPFLLLAITRHLIKHIYPNTQWERRLKSHLDAFPVIYSDRKVNVNDLGTVERWQSWW